MGSWGVLAGTLGQSSPHDESARSQLLVIFEEERSNAGQRKGQGWTVLKMLPFDPTLKRVWEGK